MNINNIIVPQEMKDSTPSPEKYEAKKYRLLHYGKYNKVQLKSPSEPIIVDGYITYLLFKNELHQNDIPVCYSSDSPYLYVYGKHDNDDKIRVWKTRTVICKPGDRVMVKTRVGVFPITVTEVKWSDVAPEDRKVRAVLRYE